MNEKSNENDNKLLSRQDFQVFPQFEKNLKIQGPKKDAKIEPREVQKNTNTKKGANISQKAPKPYVNNNENGSELAKML